MRPTDVDFKILKAIYHSRSRKFNFHAFVMSGFHFDFYTCIDTWKFWLLGIVRRWRGQNGNRMRSHNRSVAILIRG